MIFAELAFDSSEYQTSLILRENILRIPLGKKLSHNDTRDDDQQLHFGMFNESNLVACVVIKPLNQSQVRLRQMAVCNDYQGQNIGRTLINETEITLQQKGFNNIELNARKVALGFYETLGYVTEGDYFLENGIEHIKMRKRL
mgnify:FL=1